MLKYFETTTLILLWCLALSLGWGLAAYEVVARARRRPAPPPGAVGLGAGFITPALVVAPLALVGAFRLVGVNLLYPVHLLASSAELAGAALVPALVLLAASGLAGSLARQVGQEFAHWRAQPFATVAEASGQRPARVLRRLVLAKALCSAWSQCLPWLFGELIVVETVFNAPGLGLDAWHLARGRDLAGLAGAVGWLAALYAACVTAASLVSRRLGRRLESYG